MHAHFGARNNISIFILFGSLLRKITLHGFNKNYFKMSFDL